MNIDLPVPDTSTQKQYVPETQIKPLKRCILYIILYKLLYIKYKINFISFLYFFVFQNKRYFFMQCTQTKPINKMKHTAI